MKRLNFLPQSYLRQRARQQALRSLALLSILALAGAVAWYLQQQRQVQQVRGQGLLLAGQLNTAPQRAAELERLLHSKAQAAARQAIYDELAPKVPSTVLIASVVNLMPPSISLVTLSLASPPVVPQMERANEGPPGWKGNSAGGEVSRPPVPPLKIELVGLAPDDQEVARFVRALAGHPALSQARMIYSRPTETGELIGREFRVEIDVPLDHDYAPTPTPGATPTATPTPGSPADAGADRAKEMAHAQ